MGTQVKCDVQDAGIQVCLFVRNTSNMFKVLKRYLSYKKISFMSDIGIQCGLITFDHSDLK